METNHLIAGGLGVGLLTALWGKIRFVFSRLASLFVIRVHVQSYTAKALALYCWTEMKRSPFGERRYSADTEFVRSMRRYQKVAFEEIGKDPIVFWKGWRPILLGTSATNGDSANSSYMNDRSLKITMTFFRFTFNIDNLLEKAIDLLNERHEKGTKKDRFAVYHIYGLNNGGDTMFSKQQEAGGGGGDFNSRFTLGDKRVLKWDLNDLGPINEGGTALEKLALPPEAKEMINEVNFWKDSENWYRERNIPWKRGWLLHGKPGTGKTSLVRAIGEELDLPIFVFDLATLTNQGLQEYWRYMSNWVPCIALFEDIDSVFEGRKNVVRTYVVGGVTFDAVLNCLDGIEASNGVFTIMTTNRVHKVDSALGGPGVDGDDLPERPGRIDRALELGDLKKSERLKIANRILEECPEYIDRLVEISDGDTGARFSERCTRIALASHWGAPVPDPTEILSTQYSDEETKAEPVVEPERKAKRTVREACVQMGVGLERIV